MAYRSTVDAVIVCHRMRVKKLPMILALHLKRFKYMEQLQRYTKLSYRVVFPLELRLFNTSGDATNPERLYDLVAVVVHCGRCVGEHRARKRTCLNGLRRNQRCAEKSFMNQTPHSRDEWSRVFLCMRGVYLLFTHCMLEQTACYGPT